MRPFIHPWGTVLSYHVKISEINHGEVEGDRWSYWITHGVACAAGALPMDDSRYVACPLLRLPLAPFLSVHTLACSIYTSHDSV